MPPDRRHVRDRVTRENTEPRKLALVSTYYPPHLRDKILACCARQRAGDARRCCRHALCAACSPQESYRIARAQYAAFEACTPTGNHGPRLAHEVYTLPPYLRPRIATREGFAAWKDATLETIREIHGTPDVAGVMNLHPIGDEDLLTFHPHWDVVVNGYVLRDGRIPVEHRPRRIHYDDARAIYIRHLTVAFGLEGDAVPRVVDLYLDRSRGIFHTNRRKTWHTVRYSARHVYQPQNAWLHDTATRGDWWYRPTRKAVTQAYEGRQVIASLMAVDAALRGRRRRVWFGYMQNRVLPSSARLFGKEPPSKRGRRAADEGAPE